MCLDRAPLAVPPAAHVQDHGMVAGDASGRHTPGAGYVGADVPGAGPRRGNSRTRSAHRGGCANPGWLISRSTTNHVGTDVLICPAERSSAVWPSGRTCRASLDRTDEDICPYAVPADHWAARWLKILSSRPERREASGVEGPALPTANTARQTKVTSRITKAHAHGTSVRSVGRVRC